MTRVRRDEDDAVAVLSRWVGDRRVRAAVEAARPHIDLGCLDDVLGDQVAVLTFAARLVDVAPVDAAGVIGANPFGPGGWWPDPGERRGAQDDAHRLGALVHGLLTRLESDGVPVDPRAASDRAVMVGLLLLDVDWSLSPRETAEALQPLPLFGTERDGTGARWRRDSTVTTMRRAVDFAAVVMARARGDRPPLPGRRYAGGGQRTPGRQQHEAEIRRTALVAVLAEIPDVGPFDFRSISGKLTPAAEVFNAAMVRLGDRRWDAAEFSRCRRLLRDDLRDLRKNKIK